MGGQVLPGCTYRLVAAEPQPASREYRPVCPGRSATWLIQIEKLLKMPSFVKAVRK